MPQVPALKYVSSVTSRERKQEQSRPHIRLFYFAISLVLLSCWPVGAAVSAPWPAGSEINRIDQSPRAPSLAAFNGRLFMVWKAEDASNRIFIAWTSDGFHWSPGRGINRIDATPETPALAASSTKLYIAFKANDASNTIYLTSTAEPDRPWPAAHRINSSDITNAAPALYYYNDRLCMAWSSAREPHLIYFRAFTEPFLHGGGTPINEFDHTTKSPSLGSWQGKLYLSWKSQDSSNRIFLAASSDGRTWPSHGSPINSVDSTPENPVLYGTAHRLYLAFKANDSANGIYLTSSDRPDGVWAPAFTINTVDSTPLAPAIGFYQNKLFIAWKANEPSDRLFVTSSYAQESEFFFSYLGDYPADANPGWHEEAQGLAHDRDNWFITQRETLWKVPVEVDLNRLTPGRRGVRRVTIADYPALGAYHHFGDPDYLEVDGHGYLVVPVQGGPPIAPGIALFDSDSLVYVAHAYTLRSEMGWCAIDLKGRMYTSERGRNDSILRYDVDWRDLIRTASSRRSGRTTVLVYEIRPTASIRLLSPASYGQGGEVTRSGELLYVIADGIHVIDLATGRRLMESSNGLGPFNFGYSPTNPIIGGLNEEPEGMTLWDLDDGRAPNVSGQLHVIILDNDAPDDDDISFKHYGVGPIARRLDVGTRRVVAGRVLDSLGHSIDADVHVFLGTIEIGYLTAAGGNFSIYDLPTGVYRVVARTSGGGESVATRTIFARQPRVYTWELRLR